MAEEGEGPVESEGSCNGGRRSKKSARSPGGECRGRVEQRTGPQEASKEDSVEEGVPRDGLCRLELSSAGSLLLTCRGCRVSAVETLYTQEHSPPNIVAVLKS